MIVAPNSLFKFVTGPRKEVGLCTSICLRNLELFGLNGGCGAWRSFLSVVVIAVTGLALAWNLLAGKPAMAKSAHYLAVSIIYIAILLTIITKRNRMASHATKADSQFKVENDVVFGSPSEFERAKDKIKRTTVMYTSRAFKFCLRSTAAIIIIVPIYQYSRAEDGDLYSDFLPFPLHLPSTNSYIFATVYFFQMMFAVVTTCLGTFLIEYFSSITQHICMHFSILASHVLTLADEKLDEALMKEKIRHCILYHLYIYGLFYELKSIYELVFNFIYIGTALAIALSRNILSTDNDTIGIAGFFELLTVEVLELFIYSFAAETVVDANDVLRRAIYTCHWWKMPLSCRKLLLLMLTRATKVPTMNFYLGGSKVTLDTFAVILNATLTYFLVVFIFNGYNVEK